MTLWELSSHVITVGLAALGWGNYFITRRRRHHDLVEHARQEERWRRSPAELVWVALQERE